MELNPAVTVPGEPQWLDPVQRGPETLRRLALAPATLSAVMETLERLAADPFVEYMRRYYALGRERFGAAWGYLDQLTVLHAAASVTRPRRYLEIGVFRGRSLAVVASAAPEAELVGFDLWVPGYAGLENAGPELVREQLRRVGHRGPVRLVSGSSHETVPALLAESPGLCFDLVTVDGDHTEAGARRDLETVLPHVAVGGVLVFDDLRHPKCPWLERVWDEVVAAHPAFVAAKYTEVGYGVGFAVRRGEARVEVEHLSGSGSERLRRLAELLDEERAVRDERLEACEADRALRLDIINRQGDELGQVTAQRNELEAQRESLRSHALALEAERDGLRSHSQALETERLEHLARFEALEADRNLRLAVIVRQGDELGRVSAERDQMRGRLEGLERFLEYLSASIGYLQALAGERLVGLLSPRKIRRLATILDELAGRLAPWQRGGSRPGTGSTAA
jgi:predicted O-methyltransferase YrrM